MGLLLVHHHRVGVVGVAAAVVVDLQHASNVDVVADVLLFVASGGRHSAGGGGAVGVDGAGGGVAVGLSGHEGVGACDGPQRCDVRGSNPAVVVDTAACGVGHAASASLAIATVEEVVPKG